MIQFTGYGLIVVVIDYFGGLVLLSKLSPYLFKTEEQQYLALLSFHIIISCVNFFLSKYLNRKEVKHTVYGLRLEKLVLFVGIIFLPLIIMMGKDIIY
jgi:membrane protein